MTDFSSREVKRLIHDSLSGICVLDNKFRYIVVSQRWRNDFNIHDDHLEGKYHYEVFKDLPSRWKAICTQALNGHTKTCELEKFVRATGEEMWLSWIVRPWHHSGGSIAGIVIFTEVHSRQKQLETQLKRSERQHQYATTAGEVGVWDLEVATNFLAWNSVMHYLFDVTEEEFNHSYEDFINTLHPDDAERINLEINQAIIGEKDFETVYRVILKNKSLRYIRAKAQVLHDQNGNLILITGVCYDITKETIARQALNDALKKQKASKRQLEKIAFYDGITQLPNRRHYLKYIGEILADQSKPDKLVALLLLDLDDFKKINDTTGHLAGDQFLLMIGNAFRSAIPDGCFLARLGGDEFVVVIDDVKSEDQVYLVAQQLSVALKSPFSLAGRNILVTVSVGMTLEQAFLVDADQLLRQADMAMYHAKARKGSGQSASFYTEQLKLDSQARFQLEQALRSAVNNDEFSLVFQPQLDLATKALFGLEVLLRWVNPKLGFVPPSQFIPIAEEIGVINDIGCWVLRSAIKEYARWLSLRLISDNIKLSINFSPFQFIGTDVAQLIQGACTHYNVKADALIAELTETAITKNFSALSNSLQALVRLGVGVAIDDFGTGYSSLSYISQLPISYLKIDQSFLRSIPKDPRNVAIIKAVMDMAKALNLKVIAEGIEETAQLDFLSGIQCCFGQGNRLGEPLAADALVKYLEQVS